MIVAYRSVAGPMIGDCPPKLALAATVPPPVAAVSWKCRVWPAVERVFL